MSLRAPQVFTDSETRSFLASKTFSNKLQYCVPESIPQLEKEPVDAHWWFFFVLNKKFFLCV